MLEKESVSVLALFYPHDLPRVAFTGHWPRLSRHRPRPPRRLPIRRKLASFSRYIQPSFVISRNVPMINTTSNWLCFGAFLSPPSPSLRIHRPLSSRPTLHAPRRHQRGQAVRRPSRWFLHATDRRIGKNRTGPDLDEHPSISLCHRNRRFLQTKSIRFFPLAAAQPLAILSRPEALKAISSRRACWIAKSRDAYPFPYEGRFLIPAATASTARGWSLKGPCRVVGC